MPARTQRIFKYPLNTLGQGSIELPKGARFLSLEVVEQEPVAYFLVDTFNSNEFFYYVATWTGKPTDIASTDIYLGSLIIDTLVVHYFKEV